MTTCDCEPRLSTWQNQPSTPTSSTSNLYDGAGNRVAQTVTYVGAIEELSTTAGVTTTTTYYAAGGKRIAEAVNGVFSYLGNDGLGSAEVALDGSGNAQASVLYDPYGNVRYQSGTMPGSYGYTGQHADAATGLDDYNARYYDPTAGQFTSADSVAAGGLNRYAYVAGNPETATDPTGHLVCGSDVGTCSGGNGHGSGGGNSGSPPHGGCQSNCGSKGAGGGNGAGSPCGGCNGRSNPSSGGGGCQTDAACGCYANCKSSGLPGNQQISDAINDARDYERRFQGAIDTLNGWVFALTFFSTWAPGMAGMTLQSITGALGTVYTNLLVLAGLYNWESTQQRDFWDNPLKVVGFFTAAMDAVKALNLAVSALAIAAIRSGPLLAFYGAGALMGSVSSALIFTTGIANDGFHQLQLLGYNPALLLLSQI